MHRKQYKKGMIGAIIHNDIKGETIRSEFCYTLALSIGIQHRKRVNRGDKPQLHATFGSLSSIKEWLEKNPVKPNHTVCFVDDFHPQKVMILNPFDAGFFNSVRNCLITSLAPNDGYYICSPTYKGKRYKLGKFDSEKDALIACQEWKLGIARRTPKLSLLVPTLKAGLLELKARQL